MQFVERLLAIMSILFRPFFTVADQQAAIARQSDLLEPDAVTLLIARRIEYLLFDVFLLRLQTYRHDILLSLCSISVRFSFISKPLSATNTTRSTFTRRLICS